MYMLQTVLLLLRNGHVVPGEGSVDTYVKLPSIRIILIAASPAMSGVRLTGSSTRIPYVSMELDRGMN